MECGIFKEGDRLPSIMFSSLFFLILHHFCFAFVTPLRSLFPSQVQPLFANGLSMDLIIPVGVACVVVSIGSSSSTLHLALI